MNNKADPKSGHGMGDAIRIACNRQLGVLDSHFMCTSVGTIPCKAAVTVSPSETVDSVVSALRTNKTGCVVVVDDSGITQGIFSERDFILKVSEDYHSRAKQPICEFMTKEPMTVTPDVTLAYALNLMSQGGFRHLPVVDGAGRPSGVLSVKDVIDLIVSQFVEDALALE
jgi:signal-transduction protein with cAMP-binding, CBS, and nucleotidyltransferase domain